MYKVKMFYSILLVLLYCVTCNAECDCNNITSVQEDLKKELDQIKLENSKISSRLRRLEESGSHSSTDDHQQSNTASEQNDDQSVSNEIATKNSKRIEAIESTLTTVMTVLELNVPKMANKENDSDQEHRLDNIETELVYISNKIKQLNEGKALSNNMILKLDRTLKKTLYAEKANRVQFQLDIKEQVKNVNDFGRNCTKKTDEVISQLKNDLLLKQRIMKAELKMDVIELNRTVYEHIQDIDLSFDECNIRKEVTETKLKLAILDNATVKIKIDGGWSSWGSYGACSDSCSVGVKVRSRTCTQPKSSLKGHYCKGSPVHVAVCNKNTCPENRVSFTAYDLIEAHSDAIFSKTYQNYGGGYDTSLGKFTCKVPGIYMFSFQISKRWSVETDGIACSLKKNGYGKISATADPYGDDRDGYSISLTGTFYLTKYDVVHVGLCSGIDSAATVYYSSFTGVLITPDNT